MGTNRRFYRICFSILLLRAALPAAAEQMATVAERYRPSPRPDRVILTWPDDPRTTQAVTWRTDTTVRNAIAQVAVAAGGPIEAARTRIIPATSSPFDAGPWRSQYHSAVIKGLSPGTLYAYRVGDGQTWSEWFHFRTASEDPEPFCFLYFGDVQNSIRQHGSRVIREAFRHAADARFLVFAGDLVKGGVDDLLWGEFFGIGGWLYATVPMVPTPGNTEYNNGVLTGHWRNQFTLPLNSIEQVEETAYFIDYQGVRIVSLDSQRRLRDQGTWLNRVLKDNPNRWTILVFHTPLFTVHPDREDNEYLIKHWKKAVFDRHHIDLVLTGHDHSYGRSHMVDGVVYVVSVAGLDLARAKGETLARYGENAQHFQVISINDDRLTFESHTATGELYDAFELRKRPDGTNELVEILPSGTGSRR
ncbi:MAG: FN3 domain-containing metallophosphoesterase family protein [Armatimonadota bacterium]